MIYKNVKFYDGILSTIYIVNFVMYVF